jgi:hypothetical protein
MSEKSTLVIPRALMLEARKKALEEGTSVSAVVRVFLKAWVDGRLQPPEEEQKDDA